MLSMGDETMTKRQRQPERDVLNPLDYADNPNELAVQRELRRIGIENSPCPDLCPKCGGELSTGGGYVGETLLYCANDGCAQGVVWEDCEEAIRRVF
jgi:hypothetical protein